MNTIKIEKENLGESQKKKYLPSFFQNRRDDQTDCVSFRGPINSTPPFTFEFGTHGEKKKKMSGDMALDLQSSRLANTLFLN